jgi:hypothetical protein
MHKNQGKEQKRSRILDIENFKVGPRECESNLTLYLGPKIT